MVNEPADPIPPTPEESGDILDAIVRMLEGEGTAPSRGVRRVRVALRRYELLTLYVETGASYKRLGAIYGISAVTVMKDIRIALDDWRANSLETAERYRSLQLARIHAMYGYYWQAAKQGDTAAGLMIIRLMTREARLLGLDAPIKIDRTDEVIRAAADVGLDGDEAIAMVEQLLAEDRANGGGKRR